MKSGTLLQRIAIVLLPLFAQGCASVPEFKPSSPLSAAPSLLEGLVLCNEYHLPSAPSRPVTLKPLIQCVDEIAGRFPGAAAGNEGFRVFRDELHRVYDDLDRERWTESLGLEIDVAAHALMRSLWQLDRRVATPLERELARREFPMAARSLSAADWIISPGVAFHPRLESLKAGIASLAQGEGFQSGAAGEQGVEGAAVAGELCRRYRRLRSEALYLEALWRDLRDIALLAPQDAHGEAARARFSTRLGVASRELDDLRPKIAEERAKGGFRVLACRP